MLGDTTEHNQAKLGDKHSWLHLLLSTFLRTRLALAEKMQVWLQHQSITVRPSDAPDHLFVSTDSEKKQSHLLSNQPHILRDVIV